MQTHYDTLQVPRSASFEHIKAAYRSLARRHHPDRNPGCEESTRRMQRINDAYAALSDPDGRREHDAWIRAQSSVIRSAPAVGPYMHPPVQGVDQLWMFFRVLPQIAVLTVMATLLLMLLLNTRHIEAAIRASGPAEAAVTDTFARAAADGDAMVPTSSGEPTFDQLVADANTSREPRPRADMKEPQP